ncbi:hypothetical protein HK101_002662, partial [Irineochytrium annulatum]
MPPKKNKMALNEFLAAQSGAQKPSPIAAAGSWAKGKDPVASPPPAAALAPHPAALKAAKEAEASKKDADDEDLCNICTDPITYYSDKNCPLCKTTMPTAIFTDDGEKDFGDFAIDKMHFNDERLSIYFTSEQINDDVMILLRFNCPDADCDVACPNGWAELKQHVVRTHQKRLCDLCIRHQKLFTHEHTLYTDSDLDRHFRTGDPDSSFKGHPSCGFCMNHFYGDDELYDHCKKAHEQCFLCTRAGVRHQYYINYPALENHFRSDHYYCEERECMEAKFMVFASEIDLKAHDVRLFAHFSSYT